MVLLLLNLDTFRFVIFKTTLAVGNTNITQTYPKRPYSKIQTRTFRNTRISRDES